jgi:hypothetical protein
MIEPVDSTVPASDDGLLILARPNPKPREVSRMALGILLCMFLAMLGLTAIGRLLVRDHPPPWVGWTLIAVSVMLAVSLLYAALMSIIRRKNPELVVAKGRIGCRYGKRLPRGFKLSSVREVLIWTKPLDELLPQRPSPSGKDQWILLLNRPFEDLPQRVQTELRQLPFAIRMGVACLSEAWFNEPARSVAFAIARAATQHSGIAVPVVCLGPDGTIALEPTESAGVLDQSLTRAGRIKVRILLLAPVAFAAAALSPSASPSLLVAMLGSMLLPIGLALICTCSLLTRIPGRAWWPAVGLIGFVLMMGTSFAIVPFLLTVLSKFFPSVSSWFNMLRPTNAPTRTTAQAILQTWSLFMGSVFFILHTGAYIRLYLDTREPRSA